MAAFEVLVVWEYVRYIRRMLSVTSTLLAMEYLKLICCNLITYSYISLLIEDILSNRH
jgi:hypothetical protein